MTAFGKFFLSLSVLLASILLLLCVFAPQSVIGKGLGFVLNASLSYALCLFAAEKTNLKYGSTDPGRIFVFVSWAISVVSIDVLALHYFSELKSLSVRAGVLLCGALLLLYWIRRFQRTCRPTAQRE